MVASSFLADYRAAAAEREALGIPALDCESFEADDVLATLTTIVGESDLDVLLVSGWDGESYVIETLDEAQVVRPERSAVGGPARLSPADCLKPLADQPDLRRLPAVDSSG